MYPFSLPTKRINKKGTKGAPRFLSERGNSTHYVKLEHLYFLPSCHVQAKSCCLAARQES